MAKIVYQVQVRRHGQWEVEARFPTKTLAETKLSVLAGRESFRDLRIVKAEEL